MGTYRGSIELHGEYPFLLAKFGMVVKYQEWVDPPESDPVTFKVFFPGDSDDAPTIEGAFPIKEAREYPQLDDVPIEDRIRSIEHHLLLSPALFTQDGRIRVRAYRGDEVIKLGSITVVSRPSPTNQPEEEKQGSSSGLLRGGNSTTPT